MKCPSCGNRGKPDSRPRPGEAAAFEFRGRLGGKVILRCLRCSRGVFLRTFPPGYKSIPPEQWSDLDAFWQLRRAEMLADLQVKAQYPVTEYPDGPPEEERVAESQLSFVGQKQSDLSFFHAARQAGYESVDSIHELLSNRPVDFAWIALTSRQQNVIHDGYEELLAQGGVPQTDRAVARVSAAKTALKGGEAEIRQFLGSASPQP